MAVESPGGNVRLLVLEVVGTWEGVGLGKVDEFTSRWDGEGRRLGLFVLKDPSAIHAVSCYSSPFWS